MSASFCSDLILATALYETGRFEEAAPLLDEAVERGDPLTSAQARAFRAWTRAHILSTARHADNFAEIAYSNAVFVNL